MPRAPSFNFYPADFFLEICDMKNEQIGKLIKQACAYSRNPNGDHPAASILFDWIDNSQSAYDRICERNRANRKGNADQSSTTGHDKNKSSPVNPNPNPNPNHKEEKDTIVSQNKKSPRGTRLDANWTLSEDAKQFAHNEGMNDETINRVLAEFRDFWTAKTGSNATKLDWDATWRNWVRRDRSTKRAAGSNAMAGSGERVGPLTAAMRKFAAEAEAENSFF